MATEKQIASRVIQKHDTEAHWNLATNFIPKQGEIVVYDIDENHNQERFKIGDGKNNVKALPFTNTSSVIVDIPSMLMTQNIAAFIDLTKRYLNKEIILIANMGEISAPITAVTYANDNNIYWTVTAPYSNTDGDEAIAVVTKARMGVYLLTNSTGILQLCQGEFPLPKAPLPEPKQEDTGKVISITADGYTAISLPSLEEYITETELNNKGYLTSYTETDPTVPAWAKAANKPSYNLGEISDTTSYVRMTSAERTKLSGIATGAEANVQSDWNATDTSSDAYIKNKPTLGSLAAKSVVNKIDLASSVQTSLGKADTALQSFTETDPTVPSHVKNITEDDISSWNAKSEFSGNYNDLTNKPTIPSAYAHPTSHPVSMITGLATVATSGKYSDLSGAPTSMTPTAHNQASNTINAMTGYSKPSSTGAIGTSDTLNAAIGKLEKALDGKQASGSYSTTGHKHTKSEITDFPTSMTPTAHNQAANTINAMTGYSKPSSTGAIAATDTLNAAIGKLEKALDGKQASGSYSTTGHKHTKSEITDFPALATVATSGSYNDLSNKPTIPAAVTVDSALSSTSTNPVQNKVINSALAGKAASSHGNHVPTIETANNARFLRNDNTWQTVTPANIGATATSVLPNNSGEIKTKYRIATKDYTGSFSTYYYYKICDLPVNNTGNYASAIVSGRIGGWESGNMSYINALIWNRGTPSIALIDIAGTATAMSTIWNVCELVLYVNGNSTSAANTATLYAKCSGWFTFDLDLELFQSGAAITYDGTYIKTTPTGTLAASSSTTTRRVEVFNGGMQINGKKVITADAFSFDSSTNTLNITTT